MTATSAPSASAPAPKIGWFAALSPRFFAAPSVIALIAANLLPLYGVFAWGWDLYSLMLLYWMETGIIGMFAILHMALLSPVFALFLVPFFIVHFGGFMAGHFVFLTVLFGSGFKHNWSELPGFVWDLVARHGLWLVLIALFVSHLVSFVYNVLRPMWRTIPEQVAIGPAQPPANPQDVMTAPYSRIVLMHVTIIAGAMLSELFKTKLAAFVLLIVLKTAVDLAAHVRKNFRAVTTSR